MAEYGNALPQFIRRPSGEPIRRKSDDPDFPPPPPGLSQPRRPTAAPIVIEGCTAVSGSFHHSSFETFTTTGSSFCHLGGISSSIVTSSICHDMGQSPAKSDEASPIVPSKPSFLLPLSEEGSGPIVMDNTSGSATPARVESPRRRGCSPRPMSDYRAGCSLRGSMRPHRKGDGPLVIDMEAAEVLPANARVRLKPRRKASRSTTPSAEQPSADVN